MWYLIVVAQLVLLNSMFKVVKKSNKSQARLGVLTTTHGRIDTPFFMPIATKAAIKSLTAQEVKDLGAQIILSNTYHNYLKPGLKTIQKFKGLHNFMQTDLPILTDSGGYQVFSLSNLRKIKGDQIIFKSHLDGSQHTLNPQKVIDIQLALDSDIMMVLDECVGLPSTRAQALVALERTTRWAKLALDYKNQKKTKHLLFGIVQGADYQDLRLRSAKEITALDFAGYAIGGLAVGESTKTMYEVLKYTAPLLPENKPRYLMGVGYPDNIIQAVKYGIDMFDCVIPTREARHGKLYLRKKKELKGKFYETININNAKFSKEAKSINNTNLTNYSKAYLHHLFKTQEPLGLRLATLNNLEFYLTLLKDIRQTIKDGKL